MCSSRRAMTLSALTMCVVQALDHQHPCCMTENTSWLGHSFLFFILFVFSFFSHILLHFTVIEP